MVGAMLGDGCSRLGHGWYNVGSWLVQCWVMVGIKLDGGWHNVG